MVEISAASLAVRIREAMAKNGLSQQGFSSQAGVSTRTINSILSGVFGTDPRPSCDTRVCSARRLRGYAESLIRLASFLGLPIEAVMTEFGIDPKWRPVADAIAASVTHGAKSSGRIEDDFLRGILDEGRVRGGVLDWPPFYFHGGKTEGSWVR